MVILVLKENRGIQVNVVKMASVALMDSGVKLVQQVQRVPLDQPVLKVVEAKMVQLE
jgi:hypothetical protein